MPLPLLIWGAAAAAAYGVKKGFDAKGDFDDAKELNHKAQKIAEKADKKLEKIRKSAQQNLELFGENKANSYENALKPFKITADQLKHIDLSEFPDHGNVLSEFSENLVQLKMLETTFSEVAGGGIAASGGGAAAGLAAYGGVQAFAAASTGTAISGLSGAAATNATLAWLGGGSLAAGGGGMAAGAAVLGGVVAGPVLAIGGFMMASKAEEALSNAYSNKRKAQAHKKEKDIACMAVNAIKTRCEDLNNALTTLVARFDEIFADFKGLVDQKSDFRKYSSSERALTNRAFLCAGAISALLNKPLLDEDGGVTAASRETLKQATELLKQLDSM